MLLCTIKSGFLWKSTGHLRALPPLLLILVLSACSAGDPTPTAQLVQPTVEQPESVIAPATATAVLPEAVAVSPAATSLLFPTMPISDYFTRIHSKNRFLE